MKLFVSWSGGKDCMLALHRIQKEGEHHVHCLINMCDADSDKSRSHGIGKELIRQQARAMGLPILQPVSDFKSYETVFKATIEQIKTQGVEGGIFGDIYLQEHRTWIERVCADIRIHPFFPLWNCETSDLIREFVDEGFRSIVVAINQKHLEDAWLGRTIDHSFIGDITQLKNIDPCAENGEYHSFVFDGPLFNAPLKLTLGKTYQENGHLFQEIY
ncbi:MAG TPA: diphthine--ammonia ligase [Bacteroidales bacterium]|nr:diphthine--ammonia ligase [Bacteroidales bacterium]